MSDMVNVKAADLETLLFAVGCIKDIENALNQRKNDMFYQRQVPRLTEAHDALAAEWRRATREPHPEWNEPITKSDVMLIDRLWPKVEDETLDIRFLPREAPTSQSFMYEIRSLRNKGMIELGNKQSVINWGDRAPEVIGIPVLMVNLTARGIDAYNKAAAEFAADELAEKSCS